MKKWGTSLAAVLLFDWSAKRGSDHGLVLKTVLADQDIFTESNKVPSEKNSIEYL